LPIADSNREMKLARTLIDATLQDDAELESYHDLSSERMRELVDAKVAGREVV
jgi:non-homologous end joining protein Ku